ncbi:MAG: 50S ribosomal protein L32 [Candidatus Sumerlaeota bacterium]|nr:50S ribosomal protein L32 [Candidatus Sumerlaeota bacterium]
MGVPRRRHSSRRRDERRGSHKVAPPTLQPCSHCGDLTPPHRVCAKCGHYNGRAVRVVVNE